MLVISAFIPLNAAASPASDITTDPRKPGTVDFAMVMPATLHLLENDRPDHLPTLAEFAEAVTVLQRAVLVSTLRAGFCVDLRLNRRQAGQPPVADWQVQLVPRPGARAPSGARTAAFEGDWRACVRRAGRFELALEHGFKIQPSAIGGESRATASSGVLDWPVALSLSTP